MSVATTKAAREAVKREGVLASHVTAHRGATFDIPSLARSYALPAERVSQIVQRYGGSNGK